MRGGVLIQIVCGVCNVSEQAVRRAATIHGKKVCGNILMCNPKKLSLDFYRTAHEEHEMLESAKRRNARQ